MGYFSPSALGWRVSPDHLAREHVVLLGHVVSRLGLQPDLRNIDKVRNWLIPRTPSEMRAFVGRDRWWSRLL